MQVRTGKNGTPVFYLSAGGEGQQEVARHSACDLQTLLVSQRQHLQHWPPHLHIHDGRAEQLGGARETVETSGGQERERGREREQERGTLSSHYHVITIIMFSFPSYKHRRGRERGIVSSHYSPIMYLLLSLHHLSLLQAYTTQLAHKNRWLK